MIIADFHVHTKYSRDGLMDIIHCLKKFQKYGFTHIAITDHDTFRGYYEAKKIVREHSININIIPGCEIKREKIEIIGIFVNDYKIIRTKDMLEIIDLIHENYGLVILPHPYRSLYITRYRGKVRLNLNKDIIKHIDLIEAFNGRNKLSDNIRSLKLAIMLNKGYVGGSDSHISLEIGRVKVIYKHDDNDIRDLLVKQKPTIYFKQSNFTVIFSNYLSFLLKKFRGKA